MPRVRPGGGARAAARRRAVAVAVMMALVAALAGVLTLPAFKVNGVGIQGAHLLSGDLLTRTAGIGARQSIFTIDAEGARRRLAALPWVTSADVVTELPASVRISVTEKAPTLRVRRPGGDVLVAADGATLQVADAVAAAIPAGLPVLDDQRPVAGGATAAPLDSDLLRILADTAARFPEVYGVAVSAFRWQPDGLLTIVAAPGWRAILGSVGTSDGIARIPQQLAALAALRSKVDLAKPSFGYIDLEDPAAPAVGGAPGKPQPAPTAAPAPSPAAAAVSTPAPAPAASPQSSPGPTPIVVSPTH